MATRRARAAAARASTEPRGRSLSPRAEMPGYDPDVITPATRQEVYPIAMLAMVAGFLALAICASHGYLLLYGDAVSHLGIARSLVDARYPGLAQLGSVWLPLPHLLMLPFVWKMQWWQDGMAGAWPSLLCYILGMAGFYRLARRTMTPKWAFAATAFYGLNANLLYLSTTAMTEPLFLALLVWIVVVTMECVERLHAGRVVTAGARMLVLGVLILAAVMTRYDGWILGAAAWCVIAWNVWRATPIRRRVLPVFAAFTLLTVAGPVAWLTYEHIYAHDWLDFMRGPYSAREIDRRTSPPGAKHYFGWHDPAWSLMLYARTAQVDASWWETGWLVMLAALAGTWAVVRARTRLITLLLWLPLPFYVYSVSFGSVPVFIPQIYPHSFYNSRYGLELLPAFALFGGIAVDWFALWLKPRQPLAERVLQPVSLMLAVLNLVFMARATPLVLREAQVNSAGRIALETNLSQQLLGLPPGVPLMIDRGKYMGALQRTGIPLRQTINPGDYYRGLTAPADKAGYVVAGVGDDVDKAVKAHPEGLTETTVLCAYKESCARIFRSDRFFGAPAPAAAPAAK